MIKINLARQCRQSAMFGDGPTSRRHGWIYVGLSLAIGVASWWWTQIQEQEYSNLLQEKHIQTQTFAKIQSTLEHLKQTQKERQRLKEAFEVINAKQSEEIQPTVLLRGVSLSADHLAVWLDRVQIVDGIVELRGQSFSLKDVGKYVDALETHQVITSLPVVEILEEKDKNSGTVFSFMIRFVVGQQGKA